MLEELAQEITELERRNQELQAKNASLREENMDLKAQLREYEDEKQVETLDIAEQKEQLLRLVDQ